MITISKATGFHFRIGDSPGNQLDRDGNYLYPEIAQYYNVNSGPTKMVPFSDESFKADIWNTSDTPPFQIKYDNGGIAPIVVVVNANTTAIVDYIDLIEVTDNRWEGSVDMSILGEGCFYIEVREFDGTYTGPNGFLVMDQGTAELNINGVQDANTAHFNISQSNLQAEAGIYSYLRSYSSGTTNTDDQLILYPAIGNSFAFNPGDVYQIKGYVYLPSSAPYIPTQNIFWDINNTDGYGTPANAATGWATSDVTILQSVEYRRIIDGFDNWFEVSALMLGKNSVPGYWRLTSQAIPNSGGDIFVDTITLRKGNVATIARSETFSVKSNHESSTLLTYYGTSPQFGIYYSEDTDSIQHTIRVNYGGLWNWSMEDEDYSINIDSSNTSTVSLSFPTKIYTVRFEKLTSAKIEKLLLAAKHDVFYIDNVRFTLVDTDITPQFDIETGTGWVEIRLRPSEYNYQNGNC